MTVGTSPGHALAERFSRTASNYACEREAFDADMLLQFGDAKRLVRVRGGVVTDIVIPVRPLQSWDFSIWGSEQAWRSYWEPLPQPGWHDILALSKRGEMRIEGRLQPLMANLQAIKDLLALPREARA
ncbi:hypothetical protein [Bordetella sp. 15P40C-2]|uniref:hypothetical protein n=1 Tax=Bordetella sp. 15P40C-2 TaxID=2572246 RepID=UPI0013226BDA|nr:hypothetical protein [Bordetella sp. 15P40C-2]MVW72790.1 hypothetical protein [Bordetella sp. 15P40C-2]